jgi:ferritin-like metal-binding protein YciE
MRPNRLAQSLQKGAELAGDTTTADVYRAHCMQTRGHLRLIAERLNAYGASPPTAVDARIHMAGLNAEVDLEAACTPPQVGVIAYALEGVEIGLYYVLVCAAHEHHDRETEILARQILDQEEAAAEREPALSDLRGVRKRPAGSSCVCEVDTGEGSAFD